jgi:threonine/homoserine/homoserine lactone efflux protein
MVGLLTSGILFGLYAGFSPGPLLALVVSETLRHGARGGIRVALAPLITDFPIIALSLLLLAQLARFQVVLGIISLVGGMVVLKLGWESLRTRGINVDVREVRPQSLRRGIVVNFLNPSPYLFWISVGGPIMIRAAQDSYWWAAAFLIGFYPMLVGSKMILALVVGRSRDFLTGRIYIYIMRALGLVLFAFAIVLFKDGLHLMGLF